MICYLVVFGAQTKDSRLSVSGHKVLICLNPIGSIPHVFLENAKGRENYWLDIIKKQPALINAQDEKGLTPVMSIFYASYPRFFQVNTVIRCLDFDAAGLDKTLFDKNGETLLHHVIRWINFGAAMSSSPITLEVLEEIFSKLQFDAIDWIRTDRVGYCPETLLINLVKEAFINRQFDYSASLRIALKNGLGASDTPSVFLARYIEGLREQIDLFLPSCSSVAGRGVMLGVVSNIQTVFEENNWRPGLILLSLPDYPKKVLASKVFDDLKNYISNYSRQLFPLAKPGVVQSQCKISGALRVGQGFVPDFTQATMASGSSTPAHSSVYYQPPSAPDSRLTLLSPSSQPAGLSTGSRYQPQFFSAASSSSVPLLPARQPPVVVVNLVLGSEGEKYQGPIVSYAAASSSARTDYPSLPPLEATADPALNLGTSGGYQPQFFSAASSSSYLLPPATQPAPASASSWVDPLPPLEATADPASLLNLGDDPAGTTGGFDFDDGFGFNRLT